MAKPNGLSEQVRGLFEDRKQESLTPHRVFELMGVDGVTKTAERNSVRDVLTWLVRCGYLVKTGHRATAAYHYSGQGMRFQKATADELREPRIDKMTINRARVDLRADLMPARAWGKEKLGQQEAETIEQFQARGGQVQRLMASWEQAA